MDSLYDLKKILCIELVHVFAICSVKRTAWHFAIAGIYSSGYVLYLYRSLWCLIKEACKLFMSKPH